jgi:hypothetical protein
MKLLSFLTIVALLTSAAFFTGLVLNEHGVALFSLATSAAVLLLVVGDYYPMRRPFRTASASSVRRPRSKYALPMAA